jgi:hypothetical protein
MEKYLVESYTAIPVSLSLLEEKFPRTELDVKLKAAGIELDKKSRAR